MVGDFRTKITPIDQFYEHILKLSQFVNTGDVFLQPSKIHISVFDARNLFAVLMDFFEGAMPNINNIDLAMDYWMALGPQVDINIPRGRVKLDMGYLWIENNLHENQIIH